MSANTTGTTTRNIFTRWLDWPNDDKRKTLIVALLLSLVCSVLIAGTAVALRPQQIANKQTEVQRNILAVANIESDRKSLGELFAQNIEIRIVDLDGGQYVAHDNPSQYDWRRAARDPVMSKTLESQNDIAKIKRRPSQLPVYLVKEQERVKRVILPVYGYGLWSTLYGFLALEIDGRTIAGLRFYEHAETPGLGGEVDNPKWRQLWQGKLAFNAQNEIAIQVVRGRADPSNPESIYHVDALSGATLTSQGVSDLVRFWLSEQGFGHYLQRVREGGA